MSLQRTKTPAVSPVYRQAKPSATVQLGERPAEFSLCGLDIRVASRWEMRFVPDPRLVAILQFDDDNEDLPKRIFHLDPAVFGLRLLDTTQEIDVFCVSASGNEAELVPTQSPITVQSKPTRISNAVFHLFNLPCFLGDDDYILEQQTGFTEKLVRCGRVRLGADGWMITIAADANTDKATKELKAQGGYVITHVGRVERTDGSDFEQHELIDILQCIHYFLSFAMGRWIGLALPVAHDEKGSILLEQWGLPLTTSGAWQGSLSWFDSCNANLLREAFPGFCELWHDLKWTNALRDTLYWYLASNTRGPGLGVDAGIILAQTALETLAWTYCVESRKMVSRGAFDARGLSAADRIRLLATSMSIPLDLPSDSRGIAARQGKKCEDIAEAITWVRNALVHPSANRTIPHDAFFESWELSMWLLDLIILRLCMHNGNYANRLVRRYVGEVERVPWVGN